MNSLIGKQLTMPVAKGLAAMMLTSFLAGCSIPFGGYGENGQTKEEFARYVESVFKFQNQMTSQVMMLLEAGDDLSNYEEILLAEQHMQEICKPLNEYAARENDGLSIGLLLRRRVEKSAVACNKAAHQVDSYLKALSEVSLRPQS
jgi:hypothetical protein